MSPATSGEVTGGREHLCSELGQLPDPVLEFEQLPERRVHGSLHVDCHPGYVGAAGCARVDLRLREATCHALVGRATLALRQLDTLLQDERRVYGDTDDRVVDLRRQIGLLQHGVGETALAVETLTALVRDLTAAHGSDMPMVRELRRVLGSMGEAGD